MFRKRRPLAVTVDTDAMDSALRELIAMIPPERDRTPLTALLLEIGAGLLIDMRSVPVTSWPTERFQLLLNVLDRLGVQR
jgi:hypothetical protein